jgi:hypothetical protein
MDALRIAEPVMPEGYSNRRADNWRPLLAIADVAGGEWPERARRAAFALERSDTGQTTPIMLLSDIRDLFQQRTSDRLSSADIVTHLAGLYGRPWPEFGRAQKPISQNQLARLLKPFNIFPRGVRIGDETPKGYLLSDFADAFDRYLPAEVQHRNKH